MLRNCMTLMNFKAAFFSSVTAMPSVKSRMLTTFYVVGFLIRHPPHCFTRSASWYLSSATRISSVFSVRSASEHSQYSFICSSRTFSTQEVTPYMTQRLVWHSFHFDSNMAAKTGERAIRTARWTAFSIPSDDTRPKSLRIPALYKPRKLCCNEASSFESRRPLFSPV
ncbi:hypothetical protein RvY_09829-1 [Ramazzottius varieornatus]|uniref:Uncharacterized protein n=1 Tax=Ramazzottius varieornatus TaxID=947166 RepID=A0A1D1VJP3_RAMVA|nr:hypothetical protein RvY_09829-1 [Ramazzottius varieornatus]